MINRFGDKINKNKKLKFDYQIGDVLLKSNGLAYLITHYSGIYDNQYWGSPYYPDGIHLAGEDWINENQIVKKVDDKDLIKLILIAYIKELRDNINRFFEKDFIEKIEKEHLSFFIKELGVLQ